MNVGVKRRKCGMIVTNCSVSMNDGIHRRKSGMKLKKETLNYSEKF